MITKTLLALLALSSLAFAQTPELESLIAKRAKEIARINGAYKAELEKLKAKYAQAGNLNGASAADKLLDTLKIAEPAMPSGEAEFENTWWNFKMSDQVLSAICLLPQGKVESQKYAGASWKLVDQNTIEWTYPDKRRMLMKFTSEKRNELSGTWEDGTNRRVMEKLPGRPADQ